jgi:hypothetical protein
MTIKLSHPEYAVVNQINYKEILEKIFCHPIQRKMIKERE